MWNPLAVRGHRTLALLNISTAIVFEDIVQNKPLQRRLLRNIPCCMTAGWQLTLSQYGCHEITEAQNSFVQYRYSRF